MIARTISLAALALLLPLALSGCTIIPFVRVVGAPAAQQPTTEAGAYYLDTICPRNGAVYAFNAVHASRDLDTLHRVAAAAAVASETAADLLRASNAPWPSSLRPQVELLAESLDDDQRSYAAVESAATLQDAWAVQWPGQTSAGDARFVIRKAVGLGDGTRTDDCVGHYDGAAAGTSAT